MSCEEPGWREPNAAVQLRGQKRRDLQPNRDLWVAVVQRRQLLVGEVQAAADATRTAARESVACIPRQDRRTRLSASPRALHLIALMLRLFKYT